jgi:hypothetical protein
MPDISEYQHLYNVSASDTSMWQSVTSTVNIAFNPDGSFSPRAPMEVESMDRRQAVERALKYIFKHKKVPDYDTEEYGHTTAVRLYRNTWGDILLHNYHYGSVIAMVNPKHKVCVARRDTVYLDLVQKFCMEHEYKLRRPPRFPRVGNYKSITEADDLYGEVPM